MFDEKDFSMGEIQVLFVMVLITALVIHLNSQKHSNLLFEYHLRIDLRLLWTYILKEIVILPNLFEFGESCET
jgi:hypothetical protein